jgi:hypothetical protein
MATTIVIEINAISKKTVSPLDLKIISLMKKLGVKIDTGAHVKTGVEAQAGAEVRASAKALVGPTNTSGPSVAFSVADKGGNFLARKKDFDMPHPNKEGWRLRHTCVEGPESAVYIRGKLDGSHIIKLPDYWKGLIDYDTISVHLTPYGRKDELYVKDIQEDRIIVAGDHLTNVKCFYQVWADRLGKLVVEYEGDSPADYPGDQSDHSIAGYTYDVRE